MINGLTRSTAFQITKSQIKHVRKLIQINSTKTTMFDFEINPEDSIAQSRKRHARSRSFKSLQQTKQLKQNNRKMVMSMVKISGRNSLFPLNKKQKRHGNHFYEQKRRKDEIQRQNKHIAHRILTQKSEFSKQKDKQNYRQSRQLFKRLQKFNCLKKIAEDIRIKQRLVSEPSSAKSWIATKQKITQLYENAETQTPHLC